MLFAMVGGVLLGIFAMVFVTRVGMQGGQLSVAPVRDPLEVSTMAPEVAENHRSEQYAGLTSVREVMALPSEFARAEALHIVAGRANAAAVQGMIFEANGIADEIERAMLLNVLFFRLAETDPQSALALARSDDFKGIRSIELTVWRVWSRADLDDALFAARAQMSALRQIASTDPQLA
jgi:hypothetical protein